MAKSRSNAEDARLRRQYQKLKAEGKIPKTVTFTQWKARPNAPYRVRSSRVPLSDKLERAARTHTGANTGPKKPIALDRLSREVATNDRTGRRRTSSGVGGVSNPSAPKRPGQGSGRGTAPGRPAPVGSGRGTSPGRPAGTSRADMIRQWGQRVSTTATGARKPVQGSGRGTSPGRGAPVGSGRGTSPGRPATAAHTNRSGASTTSGSSKTTPSAKKTSAKKVAKKVARKSKATGRTGHGRSASAELGVTRKSDLRQQAGGMSRAEQNLRKRQQAGKISAAKMREELAKLRRLQRAAYGGGRATGK